MTNEDIRTIAGQAHDALKGVEDPVFADLDAQAQQMLFDSAASIINHGGPTTTYELKVGELAAVYVPAPPPPEGGALSAKGKKLDQDEAKLRKEREEEKERIAEWKGAVTKDEKERREEEEERFEKEEERIKKARAEQLPAHKAAPKNGPDKK